MKNLILYLLKFYKNSISPRLEFVFGKACRFTPTCGEYTIDAVEKKGVLIGLWMGTLRFIRCNPLSKPGYDPVR